MDKKQTVFLSAILGIGSIMMLSFLIISAIKAGTTACTVSNDLAVTGNVNVSGTLRVPNSGISMVSATSSTAKGIIMGVKTLTGQTNNDIDISPFTTHKVILGGDSRAAGNFEVLKDTILGDDTSDKVKAYQYCDEDGNNCHDASGGWAGSLSCHTVSSTCNSKNVCNVSCDTGTMTGGGCIFGGDTSTVIEDIPSGNGWHCGTLNTMTIYAYARCCE